MNFAFKVLHSSTAKKNKGENDALKNYFLFLSFDGVKDDIQLSRAPASRVKQKSGRHAYTLVKEAAPLNCNSTKAKITKRSFRKGRPAKWPRG